MFTAEKFIQLGRTGRSSIEAGEGGDLADQQIARLSLSIRIAVLMVFSAGQTIALKAHVRILRKRDFFLALFVARRRHTLVYQIPWTRFPGSTSKAQDDGTYESKAVGRSYREHSNDLPLRIRDLHVFEGKKWAENP